MLPEVYATEKESQYSALNFRFWFENKNLYSAELAIHEFCLSNL
jgi:hypothetical protein